MALSVKFQQNIRGVVAITGNTTTVYPTTTTSGIIYCNTYFDLNENLVSNYLQSGSTAPFFMPDNSNVLYAELLWSTQSFSNTNGINFITPTGTIPNLVHTDTQTGGYTVRRVVVTTIVKNAGSGYYGCTSIPGSNLGTCWFLAVVYSNPTFPLRSVYLTSGGASAGGTIQISNIITPSTGPCNAAVVMAANQTDYIDKTKAYIGHTASPTIPLGNPLPITATWNGQAPYAPAFAFLTPNICNGNLADPNFSFLETRGTMGHANFNAYSDNMNNGSVLVPPNRLLASLTSQNILGYLKNSQNTVYLSTSSAASTDIAYGLMIDLNEAKMVVTKSVDKDYTGKGDTLLYTIIISNEGLIPANEIFFFDTLPFGQASFVPNSLTLNGTPNSGNPQSGISLGSGFVPGDRMTITFNAILSNTLATNDSVSNFATLNYNFKPGVNVATVVDFALSNTATTTILAIGMINMNKSVDKTYSSLNQILTYTIVLSNTSDYDCTNIIFWDTLPENTTLISNSLTINGSPQSGTLDPPGINLGNITVGSSKTISFKVTVTTLPTNNMILNNSSTTFDYSNGVSTISSSNNSNEVVTTINYTSIVTTKFSTSEINPKGTTVTYYVSMKNLGNTITNSLVLVDTLPSGLDFQPGTFTENSTSTSKNPNPPGAILPNLLPNEILTISFTVLAQSIPTPNPFNNSAYISYSNILDPTTSSTYTNSINTNTVPLFIYDIDLTGYKKTVDKEYTTIGNTLNYTIIIPNKGNLPLLNPVFFDTIPNGTSLVTNSTKINEVVVSNPNFSTGISLPTINPGEILTLTFSLIVN
ncbi:MAG: hypothetical protein ACRC28_04660 [Clostridium sp.]|uniref:hypothetical protein n=1 Tax=Clostridium sp. TaxID=1506 RepID=UPI003F3C0338